LIEAATNRVARKDSPEQEGIRTTVEKEESRVTSLILQIVIFFKSTHSRQMSPKAPHLDENGRFSKRPSPLLRPFAFGFIAKEL